MAVRLRRLAAQILLAISAAYVLTSGTAAAEEGFIEDANGCKVANPSPKPNETVSWSGACESGYAHGDGTMQWYLDGVPGVRYDGSVRGGLLSGRGKLVLPDGSSYEGGWLAGQQEGQGTQTMADGTRYEGEWSNGQPNGRGTMYMPSGETLEGNWRAGEFQGTDE